MVERYNTGNSRPSNSMKDLSDNALAYDDFMNSENDTFIDRLENEKDTLAGAQKKMAAQLSEQATEFESQMTDQQSSFISQFNQQAQEFDAQLASQESRYESVLQQAGKTVLGRYEDGPWTLTSYNQLVSYAGTFWKLAASVVIGSGYTTAGTTDATWNATDRANFVDVGQDQLRSELGTIFMAAASGNAATDTQLLQAALAVGGEIVYNRPGTYLWKGYSVIKSGTSLRIAGGVRWKQDVMSRSPMLINQGFLSSRYAVSSMTRNDTYVNPWQQNNSYIGKSYITVVCPSHPFSVGNYAAFYGAVEYGYDGIMKVCAVVDADTIIVESHTPVSAASATADSNFANGLFVFQPDSNISVVCDGVIDYNRQNISASAPYGDTRYIYTALALYGLVHSTIDVRLIRNVAKYGTLLANARNVRIPYLAFDTSSDGLHVQPPYVGLDIGTLYGTTGDDLLGLTIGDYSPYEVSRGHGYSIRANHLAPQNGLTALKLAGNAPYRFWDVDIGAISGSSRLQLISGVRDNNLGWTSVGRLRIGAVRAVAQVADDIKLSVDELDSLEIGSYDIRTVDSSRAVITMGNTSDLFTKIGSIRIDNISCHSDQAAKLLLWAGTNCKIGKVKFGFDNYTPGVVSNNSDYVYYLVNIRPAATDSNGTAAAGEIGTLELTGQVTVPEANKGRLVVQAGKLDRLVLDKFIVPSGGENLLHQIAGCSDVTVFMDNVYAATLVRAASIYSAAKIFLKNTYLETQQPVFWCRAVAAASLDIYGYHSGSKGLCNFETAGTGVIHVNDANARLDVNSCITPRDGDVVFNLNVDTPWYGPVRYNGMRGIWSQVSGSLRTQTPSDTSATVYRPVWKAGQIFSMTLTQNIAIGATTATLAGLSVGDKVWLKLKQDSTGGRTVSFTDQIKLAAAWNNTDTGAGKTTFAEFIYDGTVLVLASANAWYS